jgi:Xaa-Pro aminopeptidase
MLEDLDSLFEKYEIDGLLSIGNAFDDPNMFWLTGFRSPDSVMYLKNFGEDGIVATGFNTLERVMKESFIKKTHDLTDVYIGILKDNERIKDNQDRLYRSLLETDFAGGVLGVPDNFPASHLVMLQRMGYQVQVVSDLLLEARGTKTKEEISVIRRAGVATSGAIKEIIETIKDSEIGAKNTLMHEGKPLTVGTIKLKLEHHLLDRGAESAEDSIVAVGKKGFDWHYLGEKRDRLKAHVPIIIDVFPRLKRDRYVADITRTVVKGKVSPKVKEMFETAIAALNASVDALTDNAVIDDVNLACFNTLKDRGYDSRRLNPDAVDGMTHGLGHGIGLNVHEEPSMYRLEDRFSEGNVVAIEPGVYLKSIGGVRVENDYAVTKGKAKLLTKGLEQMVFV